MMRTLRPLIFFFLASLLGGWPALSCANEDPLRLWVMTNGPAKIEVVYGPAEINSFIKEMRESHGIIIENTVLDLMIPIDSNRNFTLANFVIDNFFFAQLARFVKTENDGRPVAVEFIRWEDVYRRHNELKDPKTVEKIPDVIQIGSTVLAASSPVLSTVPWFIDARVIYYHKDLISDKSVFEDWDSFMNLCRHWPSSNPKMMVFPMALDWNAIHNIAPWIWAGGGDIIRVERNGILPFKTVIDRPEAYRGIDYLQKISQAGCAAFDEAGVGEIGDDVILRKKYASIISGPWLLKRLGPDWKQRFGIAALPAGPAGSIPFVGGSRLGILKYAKGRGHLERATQLVRFLTDSAPQFEFAVETGFPPANRDALRLYSNFLGSPAFEKSIQNGRSYAPIPGWGEFLESISFRDQIWRLWHDIAAGKSEAVLKKSLQTAARDIRMHAYTVVAKKYLPVAGLLLCGLLGLSGWRYTHVCRRHRMLLQENLRIAEELRKIRDEKRVVGPQPVDNFYIKWDGALTINGKEVVFDNALQARRLIAHMVRIALIGQSSVHCLWGYPLFGWRASGLKSEPARLFNTAVAKVNAPLKKLGLPPLLASEGRGSQSWHLVWDPSTLIKYSDIGKAENGIPAAARSRQVIEEEMTRFKTGITELSGMVAVNPAALAEKIRMESRLTQMEDIHRHYFGERQPKVSLQLKTAIKALRNARQTALNLKETGTPRQAIWGEMVQDENFLRLIASPVIDRTLRNIYNNAIKGNEDYRMAQLALVWLLENEDSTRILFGTSNEGEFANKLKTQLTHQLTLLSKELAALPEYD